MSGAPQQRSAALIEAEQNAAVANAALVAARKAEAAKKETGEGMEAGIACAVLT